MWANRIEAGCALADSLGNYRDTDAVVLGIPRGGVVVAYEISVRLGLPLGIAQAKKIGAPGNPELAIGAVAEDGTARIDQRLAAVMGATDKYIESAIHALIMMMRDQSKKFLQDPRVPIVPEKTYILVDDGIATGATVFAAAGYLKRLGARVVIAAPVCAPDTAAELRTIADAVVFLETPAAFSAVGQFYADFTQVEDETVIDLLEKAKHDS